MRILLAGFVAIAALSFYLFPAKNITPAPPSQISEQVNAVESLNYPSVKSHALKLKSYLNKQSYNEEICFLIDMKIPPGKNRFFVYDLKKDSVVDKGLVTHGGGSQTATDTLRFSNVPNSNATSIGKYKIGNEYNGKFGTAFKLNGLDKTNSEAYNRFVVLHAHACVPVKEVYPALICTSLGCPTVSPPFLERLKAYINQSDKPVLLWIYY